MLAPLLLLLLCLPVALPVDILVTVAGKLICSQPFTATVSLMEDDVLFDDVVTQANVTKCERSDTYEISGVAQDGFFQREVEIYLKIRHNCSDTTFPEYCTKVGSFATTGTVRMDIAPGVMVMTHCKFFE